VKRKLSAGLTSVTLPVFVQDTTSTTGGGLSGLTSATSGLVAEYRRQGQATWTAITLGAGTLGTWSSGGFVADGALAGAYELGIPDAVTATGARWAVVRLRGAAGMLSVLIEIELDAVNYQDATGFGLSRLDVAVSTRSTYAGGDTAGTATLLGRIPGTVQPQTGDAYARIGSAGAGLTALGDARLANLDAAVSTRSTYAGGAVASVTAPVTLTVAYDLAKTAAQIGDAMVLTPGERTALTTAVSGQVTTDHGSGSYLRNTEPDNDGIAVAATIATRINTTLISDGSVYQFTANALELAPTGGSTDLGPVLDVLGTPTGASLAEDLGAVGSGVASILEDTGTSGVVLAPGSVSSTSIANGAISSSKFTVASYSGPATGILERIDQVWRRFFRYVTRSATQIRTFADNQTTVMTTQEISASGTDQVQGPAT
jgi:hypothetical protein